MWWVTWGPEDLVLHFKEKSEVMKERKQSDMRPVSYTHMCYVMRMWKSWCCKKREYTSHDQQCDKQRKDTHTLGHHHQLYAWFTRIKASENFDCENSADVWGECGRCRQRMTTIPVATGRQTKYRVGSRSSCTYPKTKPRIMLAYMKDSSRW